MKEDQGLDDVGILDMYYFLASFQCRAKGPQRSDEIAALREERL